MSPQPDLPAPEALPDDLAAALARARAGLGPFGENLRFHSSVGSTNDVAASLARAGAPQGTTVTAEAQTAGRGRLGRTWFSPPGAGLYTSVVLRPVTMLPPARYTLVAGVAIADALRATTGLPVVIKWPNDLLVGGRKLCGILAEASARDGAIPYVIVGFGINLRPAAYPADIAETATSIDAELDRTSDRGAILVAALSALATGVADLSASRFDAILNRWRALSPSCVGSAVEWTGAGGLRRGTTAGIDAEGALLVRVGDAVERIVGGEVRWL